MAGMLVGRSSRRRSTNHPTLPLFLSETAWRWLEELLANQIHDWADPVRVFEGNFNGTYVRPGDSWDLSKCKQKAGESLREYAQRFSKQGTELPHIPDHNVILAFMSGTTCKDLVRELGSNRPQTIDELMDVVANYAAGEEAVGTFFSHKNDKGKAPTDDDEGPSRGPKKNNKKKKKAWQNKHEAIDDDFVTAVKCKKPQGPLRCCLRQDAQRALPLSQGRGQPQARGLLHAEKVLRQPRAEEG